MRCSVATCVSAAATNNFLVSAQKGRNERAQKGEFPFTVIISDKVADRAENIHGDDEGARFVTREGPARPERSGLSASGVVSYGLRIGASKHCTPPPSSPSTGAKSRFEHCTAAAASRKADYRRTAALLVNGVTRRFASPDRPMAKRRSIKIPQSGRITAAVVDHRARGGAA